MLAPQTRLGAYEIKALLGQGGMGEVYRARDTKLERDVAIKILPAGFATDPDRVARFEREARTLASLNHPNIAHVHGIEEAGSTRAIVMELVDGDDLSQRLMRGPIALADALPIARQIVEAMQIAHDHGIVHRDLKPANVKVKTDGTVKVLDFGLAKVADTHAAESSLSHSPTMLTSMPGTLLGTAAYMSPEQVKGRTADARSDVWAFGCVLFEMLTGRPAFAAPTIGEIVASILTTEPDWRALPKDTPESIRRLLRRCLEKNEHRRLRAIADARFDIEDAQQPREQALTPSNARRSQAERFVWAGAVAVLGVALLAGGLWASRPRPAPAEIRFDLITPEVAEPFLASSVALSADARQIAYVADRDGQPHLWLRAIDSVSARPLEGTGGAAFPFWSPDGRALAFFADGFLKRLDLDGGLIRRLAKTTVGIGGTWNHDGTILFARNPASALARVSADGGPVVEATRLDTGEIGHTFPHFLPDGRHFLYYVTGEGSRGIHVGELEGSSRRLLDADAGGVFTNRHLLFVRQNKLLAQELDTDRLELMGSPFEVAEEVIGLGRVYSYSLSAAGGGFAFRVGAARSMRQFAWVDRAGKPIASVGDPLVNPDGISYSPDRGQLVFFERGTTSSDLWLLDTRRGPVSRFTDDSEEDIFPMWTRDGDHIVYTAMQKGLISLYQKQVSTGRKELLFQAPTETFASDTSRDGRELVYQQMNPKTGWDVWVRPLGRTGEPISILQTEADERSARLSPDGRWVAFVSNTSGRFEVYVQPFPGPGRPVPVSTKGGDQPQWRSDGSELFYLSLDGKLTVASIKPGADRQSIDIGTPSPLFAAQSGSSIVGVITMNYAASADGQRFLVNRLLRDAGATPLRVVVNWRAVAR